MKRPSVLDKDCNYYMFREQLVPAWEVENCVDILISRLSLMVVAGF